MTPALNDQQLSDMLSSSPFHEVLHLSMGPTDIEDQSIEMHMGFNPTIARGHEGGQYHGGVIASFIDIAGDYALIWALGFGVPTINFRVDYLRPAFESDLRAVATIRRSGRTVGVVDIDVFDGQDRLVAVGRGCYGTQQG